MYININEKQLIEVVYYDDFFIFYCLGILPWGGGNEGGCPSQNYDFFFFFFTETQTQNQNRVRKVERKLFHKLKSYFLNVPMKNLIQKQLSRANI